jgi:membrane protease YdiL (CAAX protease family)
MSGGRIFAYSIGLEMLLGIVGVLGGLLTGVPALADLRFDPRAIGVGLVATLPLLLGFVALWRSPRIDLREIRETLERLLPRLLGDADGTRWLRVLAVSIAAGVGEEILFRGFLQGSLEHALGPVGGIIAASVVFGLAHAISPAYAVIAVIMGLYLGCAWRIGGNLLVPITVHAVYDAAVIGYILGSGGKSPRAEV